MLFVLSFRVFSIYLFRIWDLGKYFIGLCLLEYNHMWIVFNQVVKFKFIVQFPNSVAVILQYSKIIINVAQISVHCVYFMRSSKSIIVGGSVRFVFKFEERNWLVLSLLFSDSRGDKLCLFFIGEASVVISLEGIR
eukprot:NODE_163_length_14820_cov_0.686502.p1 type:complete len:136 gc:universal NODE_163_length_14820_cov_0.686502:12485-12078(-)